MRKLVFLATSFAICLSMVGCKKDNKLEIQHFEKTVLQDMNIEKKDLSASDLNAYYDLDYTIDNADQSEFQYPRDHYVQVYTQSQIQDFANMYMIYTDYQNKDDAQAFFNERLQLEKAYCAEHSTDSTLTSDFGSDHYIVMTRPDSFNWKFDCLYIKGDVILFTVVVFSAGDYSQLDIAWLKQIKKLHQDLGLKQPFEISQEVDILLV